MQINLLPRRTSTKYQSTTYFTNGHNGGKFKYEFIKTIYRYNYKRYYENNVTECLTNVTCLGPFPSPSPFIKLRYLLSNIYFLFGLVLKRAITLQVPLSESI